MKQGTIKAGFSLIEVLVALFILTVGLLAIAQLQVASINTLSISRHMTVATQLAESQLEYLRTVPMPSSPTTPPQAADGSNLVDAANNSILLDDSGAGGMAALGDGIPSSWHEQAGNPVNELGLPAASDDMKFFIRWTIERGSGSLVGTFNPSTNVMNMPGPGQIVIVAQVIWWESNKDRPASLNLQTLDRAAIRSSHGHMVELQSVRMEDL